MTRTVCWPDSVSPARCTAIPAVEGWDAVEVTLRRADLARVPESRLHAALEASLNCEVHILVE